LKLAAKEKTMKQLPPMGDLLDNLQRQGIRRVLLRQRRVSSCIVFNVHVALSLLFEMIEDDVFRKKVRAENK
jgi:hypothetical protein